MSKSYIDDHAPAYEFSFDPLAPPDKIIAAREALARYLERTRREKADPPPDGAGWTDIRCKGGRKMMHSNYSNGEKKEGNGPWMWRCDSCLKMEKVNKLEDYGFEITFSVPGMEYGRRHKFCKQCAEIYAKSLKAIADELDRVSGDCV